MSIKIMSAVWEIEGIDSSECLVLMALADHADDAGRCYPSIGRLSKRTKLSDRGVQKVVSRLIDKGYVRVVPAAGQGGANVYIVTATPEPRSPLNDVHPRTEFTTPPNHVRKTPEPRSPKPSRTIIEPSDMSVGETPLSVLCGVVSKRNAESFLKVRKEMKKPVSIIAAERLAISLAKIADLGGDPNDALGMCQEKGWLSIKPDWYFKDHQNDRRSSRTDQRSAPRTHPTDRAIAFAAGAVRTPSKDCF